MTGLGDALECEEVSDCDVVDGFFFVIYSNVRWDSVCGFETVGEVFDDIDDDK